MCCPAAEGHKYILVDWSGREDGGALPPFYPLLYDSSLDNHGGRGINVVTVSGLLRWDSGGEWLKGLAAKYPEIKLPEGVE